LNVLFACHRLPYPPKRGGKIRPFNIIRHLTESGHKVTVATLSRSDEESEEGLGLREYCDEVHVGQIGRWAAIMQMIARLPTPVPSSMGYFYNRKLLRDVERLLQTRKFDLVFVHCSSAAQYVHSAQGIPSIIDFGDMDSHKWKDYSSFKPFPLSLGYRFEALKLRRAEERLARKFSLSTCTTKAELETLRGYEAAQRTGWFPNGVDAEFFHPGEQQYDADTICFVGRMDYYPNQQAMLQFCSAVLPELQARRPAVKLLIVGAEPSREIRDLGHLDGVTVTGTVADVRDYVRSAALTVAPLQIARGTQNKILESMAMGVPVVCSSLAANGVDAVPGDHLLVADTPRDYVTAILRLLEDRAERMRLAEAGRARILANHNWQQSMQKLDGIVAGLAGNKA
jgi:sugar transferase (PEP-CTERM/EpsH1 system associated)